MVGLTQSNVGLYLAMDMIIMMCHVWATMPLRRKYAPKYGVAPSWTGLLEVPLAAAMLLALTDLIHLLT